MAITYLGSKRVQGTKVDRVVDSLGSSADGTNTGITLVTVDKPETTDGTYNTGGATNANRLGLSKSGTQVAEGTKITKIGGYYHATTNQPYNTKFAVYTNNGSGAPDTLICKTASVNPTGTGWLDFDVDGGDHTITSGQAGYLWIGLISDENNYIGSKGGQTAGFREDEESSLNIPSSFTQNHSHNTEFAFRVTTDKSVSKLGTGAYKWDATTDSVDIPANIDLGVGSASFTIAGWVKFDSLGANREILRYQVSDGSSKVELYYSTSAGVLIADLAGSGKYILPKVEANKWYHIAIRRVSGDKDYAYINGQFTQSESSQASIPASGSNYIWYFGNRKEKNEPMVGSLDDWGFWSRALTESEILSLVNITATQGYNGGFGANGTYVGGGGGGSGSAGNDGVSGTGGNGGNGLASSITGTSLTYGAGGGGGGSGATSGSAGSNTASNYGKGGTGSGATGNAGVVILRFTTSGTTYSTSGSPNVDTSSVSGKTILKYTSSGTFVVAGGTPDVEYLVLGGGAGSGVDSYGANRGFGGGGGGGILTGTKSSMSNATYTVTIGSAGSAGASNNDGGDGGNSVFDDLTAYGGGGGASHYSSSSGGLWGRGGCKGTGGGAQNSTNTKGIAVYNTNEGALVSSLTDKSGLKAHYTMDTQSGKIGSANGVFDGSTYATANGLRSTISGASALSISCWINPTDITDSTMLGAWHGSLSNSEVLLYSIQGTNKLNASIKDGSNNRAFISSASISANEWTHAVMTYDGSNQKVKLYINGALDSEHTSNVPSTLNSSSNVPIIIGAHSALVNFFAGAMNQLLVYSDVLSLTEIQTLYNSGSGDSSPSTSSLVSWYKLQSDTNDTQENNNGTNSGITFSGDICPNDFSTTSALDEQTNLPVNTIFEQTDDTPSYWWKQSDNTWALDGSVTTGELPTGWAEVAGASSGKNFTIDTANNELDVKFLGNSASGHGGNANYDLGTALGNEWVLRFTINYSTMYGNQGVGYVGLFNSLSDTNTAQNAVYVVFMNNDNNVNVEGVANQAPNQQFGTNVSATLSTGTDYYVTLSRTADDSATIDIKTGGYDGTSLTNYPSTSSNGMSSSVSGLKYIKVTDRAGYSTGTSNGDIGVIKHIGLQKGRTTWLE